ncbi:hypothetical protein OIO90_005269 [Microbotryomycetes sp. JL221]|nr:hypothetical protein OIO90_005269 [Microbotryomycetes sp. JL221]
MPTYAITGSSRGLGFGYARGLLEADSSINVVALCRNPETATQLQELKKEFEGRVELVKHEASSEQSAQDAVKAVEGLDIAKGGVDALIANAGILAGGWAGPTDNNFVQLLKDNFEVNVYGLVYTYLAFLPLLRKGQKKQIFFLSSVLGSIGSDFAKAPVAASYSTSKTAVNMIASKLAAELGKDGFTVVPFHPGYVKTDMNGGDSGHGEISVKEAVDGAVKVFLKVTPEDNGKFYQYKGDTLPW